MTMPLVSVIIPCWNGERFVANAIESALCQSYRDVEVIVIDDGSTDGTAEVLKTFGDRIRWETTSNRGGSAARNRGIEMSRGGLIQFLDADDLLYPNKLSRMVPVVSQAGTNALVLSDWDVVQEEMGPAKQRVRIQHDRGDAFISFLKSGVITSSPLHRRKALEAVGGFRVGLPCCQEYDLHLRLAARGLEIIHVPEALWLHRRTAGSVSSSMHKVLLTREEVLLANRSELAAAGRLTEERAQAIAEEFMKCARLLVRHGDARAAKRYVKHAHESDSVSKGLAAFNRPGSRALARSIGPVHAEIAIQHFVRLKQQIARRSQRETT